MAGGFLSARLIRLSELETPVRRVIFTTYAVLLGIALAVALKDFMRGTPYLADPGIPIQPMVAWLAAAGAGMGIVLMASGAMHARTRWRYPIVALLLLTGAGSAWESLAITLVPRPAFENWLAFAVPAAFLLACLFLAIRAPRMAIRRVLFAMTTLVVIYAAAVIAVSVFIWPAFGPTTLFLTLGVAAFALEPALLVIGWDIAEIGGTAAAIAERLLARRFAPRLLAIGIAAMTIASGVSLAFGFFIGGWRTLTVFLSWTLVITIVIAGMTAIAIRAPAPVKKPHEGLSYLVPFSIAAVIFIGSLTTIAFTEPVQGFFQHEAYHPFSIVLPQGFQEDPYASLPLASEPPWTRANMRVIFLWKGRALPSLAVFASLEPPFALPGQQPTTLNEILALPKSIPPIPLRMPRPSADGWRHGEFHVVKRRGHGVQFFALERDVHTPNIDTNISWFIACGDKEQKAAATRDLCENVRSHFVSELVTQSSRRYAAILDAVFWLAALAALALGLSRRGPLPPTVMTFAGLALVLAAVRQSAGFLFGGIDEALQNTGLATALLSSVLSAAGIGALTIEAWPQSWSGEFDRAAARSKVSQALMGLLVIAIVFLLYVFAADRSENSQVIRGIVVCLALTWELATSSAALSPTSERHAFGRSSRLLIQMGYLTLVATCVFMFGQTRLWTGELMAGWDTEGTVASGIVELGAAWIIAEAIGRIARARVPPAPAATDVPLVPDETPRLDS